MLNKELCGGRVEIGKEELSVNSSLLFKYRCAIENGRSALALTFDKRPVMAIPWELPTLTPSQAEVTRQLVGRVVGHSGTD